jgi:hypothetical protein
MTNQDKRALIAQLERADAELVLMTQNDRVVLNREVLEMLIDLLRVKVK